MIKQSFDTLIDQSSKRVSNGYIKLSVIDLSDKHTRMAVVDYQQMVKVLDAFIKNKCITDGSAALILDCDEHTIRKIPGAKPKFKHLSPIRYFFYREDEFDQTRMYVNTDPYILPDLKYGIHIDNVCHRHDIVMKEIDDSDALIEAACNVEQTLADIVTDNIPFGKYEDAVIEFFNQLETADSRVGATAT